jgi:hypothetical protein
VTFQSFRIDLISMQVGQGSNADFTFENLEFRD